MSGNQYFYFNTIRAITVAFSDLFNNIYVERLDDSGAVAKHFKLPLTFGPVNKFQYIRTEQESGQKYYLQLPRLAISLDGFKHNAERTVGVNQIRQLFETSADYRLADRVMTNIQPAPYDLTYSLHVFTETMDEYNQVFEQVLPFFNPATHLRLKEFGSLNLERDIKVTIGGINVEYVNPQEEDEKRQIIGTIDFTVQAYMYRPLTDHALIKEIISTYNVQGTDYTSGAETTIYELSNQYKTSGFAATSAFPETSAYDFSAAFEYIDLTNNETSTGGAFTSAIRGE
jgi:hypothetical protein